jgi:transcription termination/antitermination protein NusG
VSNTDTEKSTIDSHWYAAHVRSRHEKRVADQLSGKNVDFFLPLYTAKHRWSDRTTNVEIPLFPGYLFVRIDLKERLKVLEVPGVLRFVSSGASAIPLDDSEINILRQGLAARLKAEPHPYLKVGTRVRVKAGPLAGLEGVVERSKDSWKLIISLHLIMRSISVEISATDVEAV